MARRIADEAAAARGLLVFMASNALWIALGWHTHAWALIALQVALGFLNVRGARKNDAG